MPSILATVTLEPVPEEDDVAQFEAMMAEIDAGTVAPVPRERSPKGQGHPKFDSLISVALLIPIPDFRLMAYASMDDMVDDAWMSPEAVKLELPAAFANMRDKRAAGVQVVTRERATVSKY